MVELHKMNVVDDNEQRRRVFGGRRQPGYPPIPVYSTQTVASPQRVLAGVTFAGAFLFGRRHPSPGWRTQTRIHREIRAYYIEKFELII